MPWQNANSSMIDAYDYDADMGVLHVRFHGGEVHSLQNVPEQLAGEFASSASKGKFWHNNLKGQYKAL